MGVPTEASTSQQQLPLVTSNSRLALSLAAPPHGSFAAGTTIYPTLELKGSTEYTELSLRLKGDTSACIMGKERWQKGMLLNASMGGPAVSITTQERLTFLDIDIPLGRSTGVAEKKGDVAESTTAGVYEVTIPCASDELLPSYKKSDLDQAGVGVRYTLELLGKRSGMFKTKDKLTLEVPVSVPLSPPLPANIPPSQYLCATSTQPLKFKGTSAGDSLSVEAKLTIIPLPYANTPLLFTLTLTPSLPSALPLLTGPDGSPNVKILAVAVSRKVTTNPVRDPGMGQADFQWAGVRIAPAQLAGEGRLERSGGGWEVQGKVEVPSGECTVDSRGVKIAYSLGCQISSPVLEKLLVVSLPVFLPSAPKELSGGGGDGSGMRQGIEEGGLPSYTA